MKGCIAELNFSGKRTSRSAAVVEWNDRFAAYTACIGEFQWFAVPCARLNALKCSILSILWGYQEPSIHGSSGLYMSLSTPNRLMIDSAVFAQLTLVPNFTRTSRQTRHTHTHTHTHTLTHGIRSVAIGCIPHLRASSCMRCCHWWSACSTLQSIVLPCIVRLSCRSANSTNMHARHVADSHVRDTPDHLNDTFKWSESRYNVSWHLRKTSNTSDLTWHVSVIHHITSHGEYRSRPPKAFVSEK